MLSLGLNLTASPPAAAGKKQKKTKDLQNHEEKRKWGTAHIDAARPPISLRPPEVVWRRGGPRLTLSRVDSWMQTASMSERAAEIILKGALKMLGTRHNTKFFRPRDEKVERETTTTTTPTEKKTSFLGLKGAAASVFAGPRRVRACTSIRQRACKRPNATA